MVAAHLPSAPTLGSSCAANPPVSGATSPYIVAIADAGPGPPASTASTCTRIVTGPAPRSTEVGVTVSPRSSGAPLSGTTQSFGGTTAAAATAVSSSVALHVTAVTAEASCRVLSARYRAIDDPLTHRPTI